MIFNRTLQIAFIVSFATHIVVVAQNPGNMFFPQAPKAKKLEINYIKTTAKVNAQAPKKTVNPASEPLLDLSSKINLSKRNPPPFIDREVLSKVNTRAMRKEMLFDKPALVKPDIIAVRKKITLPAVDMAKIGNPSYIGYYQVVREKIRRSAYQNYNRSDTGEIYVTFVISNAGYLNDVRLVEEKSRGADYLKEIALASVRNAAPFPKFPKELDYSQLSFNVVISFEVE
ncbi:MAG: TonB family protein [Candidatus Omnitrophica bacterium]|nr:TonB family protein [Candidatus Omnitrophota bacterium]